MMRALPSLIAGISGLALLLLAMVYASPVDAAVSFRSAASASAAAGAITYVGAGAMSQNNNGNSAPGYPANWQVGDLLLCIVESRDNSAVTMPAGWAILSQEDNGGGHRATLFWKFAEVGDATAPTVVHKGNAIIARIIGFRGVDATNPFDAANSFTASPADLTTEAAGITTATANAMLIYTAHMADSLTGITTPAGSAPWTRAFFDATSNGNKANNAAIAAYYELRAAAGAQAAVVATRTGGTDAVSHGAQIALRPAAAGLTINKPAGTSPGDVLIASIGVRPASVQIAPPSGWTEIRTVQQSAGNTSKLVTYRRLAGLGEPASHTWAFSGGSHMGTVGSIAAFIGVDSTTPVDDELGQTTISSTTHEAPSVTTILDNSMLVTIHQFASSRAWTPPTGMTEAADVSSETPNSDVGISMEFNYEARPTAGPTNTRTASAGGNADTGATQSIALRAGPLTCRTDDFNRANGAPGTGWTISNSGGSFGNPVILNNRLRLTDATGNVATMATLQQLFPGAGNRIEVEFEHYAYGGSGADGIVLVLSDSSIAPAPGGYGGSLGYAQNTSATPSKPGFAGGWLGVGIDEYGNFSNPTEGRVGGPGLRIDSVSVRGSGTGTTGYAYHTGTAANLNPQVDNNGAASPPHRYRIIVDHSNGLNAMVSVERDTGSGYQMLIAPYDAKARGGQAAVPTSWILSWTGSTGGSTNIHEIDNLNICATSQYTPPPIHHFDIDTGGSTGSSCGPQTITITARDVGGNVLPSYAGTINVSTSINAGNWSLAQGGGTLVAGASNTGNASYIFAPGDNGVVTLNLSYTGQNTLTISVVDAMLGSTLSTSTPIDFDNDNFVVEITDPLGAFPIAGRNHNIRVTRYSNCGVSTVNGNRDVALWLTADSNHPITATAPTVTDSQSGTPLSLPFAAATANIAHNINLFFVNGVADFQLATTDVGKYALNIREDDRRAGSSVLTTRPWLHITVPGNPGGSAAGDALFGSAPPINSAISAGSNFAGTVRGVLWSSADDPDNDGVPASGADLADNPAAPRFAWPTELTAIAPMTPVGGTLGSLGSGSIAQASFGNGAATVNSLQYSEVGSFTLQALAEDYLGTAGLDLSTTLGPVGRFRPDHFAVSGGTVTNRAAAGCAPASTFTYMDEPLQLTFTLTAQNANNATTQNYVGSFAKLNAASAASYDFGAHDAASATDLTPRAGVVGVSGNWTGGNANILATVAIARPTPDTPPDGPYNGVRLGVVATDPESVTVPVSARTLDVNGDAINDYAQLGSDPTSARYGRLRLFNALGSERIALPMRMQIEYWNGTSFTVNSADSCTTLLPSDIALSNYQIYAAGSCPTAITSAPISFSSGKATAMLAPPLNAGNGSVDLRANLSASSGNYCATAGGLEAAASSAARRYLKGRWDDAVDGDGDGIPTGYDDDPIARATFGVYGPQAPSRFIYSRENY